MPRKGYGWRYQKARKALLAAVAVCEHCGRRPSSEADHEPPLSRHIHLEGSGCCVLVASCWACAREQGALLATRSPRRSGEVAPVEPAGFDVDSPVWDVGWLDELRQVPEEGWWPRLMTVPHPKATGSLGVEVVDWARGELGLELRWWQRLFLVRLLEHDGAGRLVWRNAVLSVARQSGKSVLVYVLCEWRSEQHERFGEDQLVLHTADNLDSAKEVQARAKERARLRGFKVREAAGELEIRKGPGRDDRWLVRSQSGVVGHSASFAVADEAHHVKLKTVLENLGPTTVEKRDSQLLLVSTAHSECSELMPLRRGRALDELEAPQRSLILEWSAPWGTRVADVVGARQASPFWHPDRAAQIVDDAAAAAMFEGVGPGRHDVVVGFGCQWHNIWPPDAGPKVKGELLVEPGQWSAAFCDVGSSGPMVIGIEDQTGRGAAVGVCGRLGDGRFVLGGMLRPTRAEAYELAAEIVAARPGSTLVVGASLHKDADLRSVGVTRRLLAGSKETAGALTGLRELLATGRVVQDGSADLEEQVLAARVTMGTLGLSLASGVRTDLLRAAGWALQVAVNQPTPVIHTARRTA